MTSTDNVITYSAQASSVVSRSAQESGYLYKAMSAFGNPLDQETTVRNMMQYRISQETDVNAAAIVVTNTDGLNRNHKAIYSVYSKGGVIVIVKPQRQVVFDWMNAQGIRADQGIFPAEFATYMVIGKDAIRVFDNMREGKSLDQTVNEAVAFANGAVKANVQAPTRGENSSESNAAVETPAPATDLVISDASQLNDKNIDSAIYNAINTYKGGVIISNISVRQLGDWMNNKGLYFPSKQFPDNDKMISYVLIVKTADKAGVKAGFEGTYTTLDAAKKQYDTLCAIYK